MPRLRVKLAYQISLHMVMTDQLRHSRTDGETVQEAQEETLREYVQAERS